MRRTPGNCSGSFCIQALRGTCDRQSYDLSMSTYKVSEMHFKQNTGAIEKVINEEAKDGWELHTLTTYSNLNDGWKNPMR